MVLPLILIQKVSHIQTVANCRLTRVALPSTHVQLETDVIKNYNNAIHGGMNYWDVRSIIDMSHLVFETPFTQLPPHSMNHSAAGISVESLSWVSCYTILRAFNWDIYTWNVSTVPTMYATFFNVVKCNKAIGNQNVSSVTTVRGMYQLQSRHC